MKNTNENRSKILLTRLKPAEFQWLEEGFGKTRFRKLSEYTRSVLLKEPVTVIYRDQSLDDILEELVLLRKELNAIGNNLNQAVRQINSSPEGPSSLLWAALLLEINNKVGPSIEHIKEQINTYADLWSQKLRAGKA